MSFPFCSDVNSLYVLFCLLAVDTAAEEIKIGYLISWSSNLSYGNRFAGAITRALDDINSDPNLLAGHRLVFIDRNCACESTAAVGSATDMLCNENVAAFIGPACSEGCLSAGLLSTYYKIPMISYSCSSIELSNKIVYPYFVRTKAFARGSQKWSPLVFRALLRRFKWNRVCVVESMDQIYTAIAIETLKVFERDGFKLGRHFRYTFASFGLGEYFDLLAEVESDCRVVVALISRTEMIRMLTQAYKRGMLQQQVYVFIHVDFEWAAVYRQEVTEELPTVNELMEKALHGLLTVSAMRPNESDATYYEFVRDVRRRVALPPFNRTDLLATTSIINSAAYLYDATVLYATALDKVLKEGGSVTSTQLIIDTMKNTTFMGVSGEVNIDENGDRIPTFLIQNWQGNRLVDIAWFNPLVNESVRMYAGVKIVFPGNSSSVPLDTPRCGFNGEYCPERKSEANSTHVYFLVLLIVLVFIMIAIYFYRKRCNEIQALCKSLIVDAHCITFGEGHSSYKSKTTLLSSRSSVREQTTDHSSLVGNVRGRKERLPSEIFSNGGARVVLYKSDRAFMKRVKNSKSDLNKELLLQLKLIKEVNHPNVNNLLGVTMSSNNLFVLWSYCSKGNLQDILQNYDLECDWMFRMSFVVDIVKGMIEIHRSPIGAHGSLSSKTCVIDNRWVCKITNFGLKCLQADKDREDSFNPYIVNKKKFWTAPELLDNNKDAPFTKEGDVYSLAIIMYEILTRADPYDTNSHQPEEILELVKLQLRPPFRPAIPANAGAPAGYVDLMRKCWDDAPSVRPNFRSIYVTLMKNTAISKRSLVDHMLLMMEKYTNNLEGLVADRTRQLEEEKLKTDQLLYKMLPEPVANKLKEGQPVLAEQFESVTIFFSDIVGFTSLCSRSTPLQVVDLLNDLYSCFDQCIDEYDVYKVETIGDAYMVVSGLPVRNGNQHAGEIATMSLDLLSCVKTFKIRHEPETQLQLRIGIHTGPCVAGVVGLKMPRYCLFGDTVNYASRMESSGLALRIHVSPESKSVLRQLEGYHLIERGPVEMKGKGSIVTFFLTGKDGFVKPLPDLSRAAGIQEHTFK